MFPLGVESGRSRVASSVLAEFTAEGPQSAKSGTRIDLFDSLGRIHVILAVSLRGARLGVDAIFIVI